MCESKTTSSKSERSRWFCFGGGSLRFDARKVVLWILLILGVAVTWGLWAILGEIQSKYDAKKAGQEPAATMKSQE